MARPSIFEWEAQEYEHREKPADWYWALGIVAVAAIIACILFGNILLALVILAAAGAIAVAAAKAPQVHRFVITEDGLMIGHRLYPYDIMLHFSIMEHVEGAHPHRLSIKTRSLFTPHLLIPLPGVDAEEIYVYLSNHLDEGFHQHGLMDRLVEKFQL